MNLEDLEDLIRSALSYHRDPGTDIIYTYFIYPPSYERKLKDIFDHWNESLYYFTLKEPDYKDVQLAWEHDKLTEPIVFNIITFPGWEENHSQEFVGFIDKLSDELEVCIELRG